MGAMIVIMSAIAAIAAGHSNAGYTAMSAAMGTGMGYWVWGMGYGGEMAKLV